MKRDNLLRPVLMASQFADVHLPETQPKLGTPAVFVSQTGQDEPSMVFASYLCDVLLKEHCIVAFFDARSLQTGEAWENRIERCVQGCQVFVCVLSPSFFRSFWCMHELDLAFRSERKIIPVCYSCKPPRVDECMRKSLSELLQEKKVTDASNVLDRWCENLEKLKAIQGAYNCSISKLKEVDFRDTVVEDVLKALQR